MRLTVRRVKSLDIGAMREMAVDFMHEVEAGLEYPHMDENEVDKHMLEVLSMLDNPEAMFLIAYDGKKPVGFYTGYVGNKPYSKPTRVAVAQELYVVPDKRAGLVGLRLMEEAGKIAIELGAEGFECIGTYQGTDRRWEKFGFKPHVTYGHMEPATFMSIVQRFTRGRAA